MDDDRNGADREPVTMLHNRLGAALRGRRVAVVGASDNSRWSHLMHETASAYGFTDNLHLVNRGGGRAHGTVTSTSCCAIGEPIDTGLLLVKGEAVPDALRDLAAAGATCAVTLASGFGETGAHGRAAQRGLAALAEELGLTLFGPNCLGFVNYVDRTAAWAAPAPVPTAEPGTIALVSQSGAIAVQLGRFAAKQAIRFSHIVSTGNEAMVGTIEVAEALVDDERVGCLALFVEAISDVPRFDAFTARAAALDKPVIMLKAGRSALATEVIASHTGSLAGDDRVIDAALRQAGVVRVASLEELIVTAGLFARIGRTAPGKLGVVSISGGACDMVADAAESFGTPLATFSQQTLHALTAEGSPATPRNPFDVTGAAVGGAHLMGDAVRAVAADPDVALVAVIDVLPDGVTVPAPSERLGVIGEAMREAAAPCIVVHQVTQDVPIELGPRLMELGAEPWVCGIDRAVQASGHLLRRSAWSRSPAHPDAGAPLPVDPRTMTELEALALLGENGVPIVPALHASSPDEAVAAAHQLGLPVVLKVSSREIFHKSDIGGVELDLRDEGSVRDAFDRVMDAAAAHGVTAEGALVAPMRRGGIELIAGIVRDAQWGLVLAVGLGGVWVNVLNDSSLRRLPVGAREIEQMLGELRGGAVLDGIRGGAPADLPRVAEAIASLAAVAARLGPGLESIEINPLWVDGATVEALDAVVTWS